MNSQIPLSLLVAVSGSVFMLSVAVGPLAASNNEPSTELSSQLNVLRNRVTQLENAKAAGTGRVVVAPTQDLTARVATLSQAVTNLTNVVKVGPNSVSINASTITMNAATNISIKAGMNMQLQSVAQMSVSGGAVTKVNGPMLILNNGAYPITTINSKSGVGSPTVMAP